MPKADQLIRTKLRLPLTRPGLISRPRLQEQIAQGLCGPLTLITAPAGFGKTTLVASSVSHSGMPVAWLSLDKDDNRAGRFLNYLVAALQEADSTIGSEAGQLLAESGQAATETILTSLVNDLDIARKEVILVLDDYQLMSNLAVHEEVIFLLEHCPKTFHLVIATRSDPPIPLTRLRARGQTVELRAADLRFTELEAAQFLDEVMGLHLDAGSVAVLEERTEGWIAGLQMAALSMRDREDVPGFIERFSGTNRYILDYLLEEVLAREPEEVQTFLLRTAILTRLTGPLCDAVTGSSCGQEMLERLERRNLFIVPLDDERRWYRYHHLFAELLQSRLHQSGPELVAQLLSRAADWLERDGQAAEAIGYTLAARDFSKAVGLIGKYWGPFLNDGAIETVSSWLAALPEEIVRNSAPLSIARCWVLWFDGQVGAIAAPLEDAEAALRRPGAGEGVYADDEIYIILPTMIAALRSIVAHYGNDFNAAREHAEQALAVIPGNLPLQTSAVIRTLIFMALATAYDGAGDIERAVDAYRETVRLSRISRNPAGVAGLTHRMSLVLRLLGRLNEVEASCREALRYYETEGLARLPTAGILHVTLADVLLERNDLELAESHLARGSELGRRSGRFDSVRNAVQTLVRLRLARGDADGALAAVEEAESALGKVPSRQSKAALLAFRSGILARQGYLPEAKNCVEEAARLSAQDHGYVSELVALATVRVRVAYSQPGEAMTLLTNYLHSVEEQGRLGPAMEMRILRSLALQRQGAAQEAEADLQRALALAEPEGYMRIFLDEGQPMQLLLAQWLAHAGSSHLRDYAIRLLRQFNNDQLPVKEVQEKTSPAGDLREPLSQRELEVLHLIALGKTNQEIARQLFVSPGTIKAHTASIYRKLDVANRTEAAACARQLGILP